MSKNIYILPAWGDTTKDASYDYLISKAKSLGYNFVSLDFNTRNEKFSLGTENSLASIIDSQIRQVQIPVEDSIIIGFSIGALIAYQISTKIKFRKTICCSISPMLGHFIKQFLREEFADLSDSQYNEMMEVDFVPLVSNDSYFFCGEKESDFMKSAGKELSAINKSKYIEIGEQDHIFDVGYMNEVIKYI